MQISASRGANITVYGRLAWSSCGEIQETSAEAANGMYAVKLSSSGTVRNVYCDMGGLFGAPAMLVYQSHALPKESRASESTAKVGSVSPTPSPSVTGLLKLSDAEIAEYRGSLRAKGAAALNDVVSRGVYDGAEVGHMWMHPDCVLDFAATAASGAGSPCQKATMTSSSATDYRTGTHAGWPTAVWSKAFSEYGFIVGHQNGRFYLGGSTQLSGFHHHGTNDPAYYCGTGDAGDDCSKPATLEFWIEG